MGEQTVSTRLGPIGKVADYLTFALHVVLAVFTLHQVVADDRSVGCLLPGARPSQDRQARLHAEPHDMSRTHSSLLPDCHLVRSAMCRSAYLPEDDGFMVS
jgi:hypothetical protein